jgi:hypothetical protein
MDRCARVAVVLMASFSIFVYVGLLSSLWSPPPVVAVQVVRSLRFYLLVGLLLLLICIALIAIWGSFRQWRLRIILPIALLPFLALWYAM